MPEVVLVPDHAPEAVHDVALVADQVSVLVLPAVMELGLTDNETVGAVSTMTVTACAAVPPVPLQASE